MRIFQEIQIFWNPIFQCDSSLFFCSRNVWLLLGKKEHSTCGAGTAHPSGAPDFIPSFEWGLCYFVFSIMCMLCRSLFFLLVIVLSVLLRFMDSDYPFGIFKLFLPKLELKYCSLNLNSAENVTNIQFKIILVKQTDRQWTDRRWWMPSDTKSWHNPQVSKKKTFYFVKLWITGLNYNTIKPIIGITSIQWKKYIT